jgi:hypothetical protein
MNNFIATEIQNRFINFCKNYKKDIDQKFLNKMRKNIFYDYLKEYENKFSFVVAHRLSDNPTLVLNYNGDCFVISFEEIKSLSEK